MTLLSAPNDGASVGSLITQILVGVGGFAGIASAINAVFSRRKTRAEAGTLDATAAKANADAASVISDTAASQVQRMDLRILAQEKKLSEQENRIGALEDEARASRDRERAADERERDLHRRLREYADWSAVATGALSEHGIVLDPPPIYTELRRSRPPPD